MLDPSTQPQIQKTCDLVDAFGPVSHELHNLFNGMVLQVALVTRRAPDELHEKLEVLKSLALQASEKLGQLDSVRHHLNAPQTEIDLHCLIEQSVQEFALEEITLTTELLAESPKAHSNSWELSRLLSQVLRCSQNALLAAEKPGSILVRTESLESQTLILVEDNGPGMEPDREADFHDPFHPIRPGENALDRAASYTLAKRLGIQLTVQNVEPQGIRTSLQIQLGKSS